MVQGTAHALDVGHSGGTEAMIRIVPEKMSIPQNRGGMDYEESHARES